MIQMMNRKDIIEMICSIQSRWKTKKKVQETNSDRQKQTWTGIDRDRYRPTETSQCYFVQQNLHKVLPGTTSYYRACTKYVPVLLRTTKLAQSISRYYFVLQRLHKVLPSLLRTTKLAQNTSKSQFYHIFGRSNLISCEKVAAEDVKSQFYRIFWRSNLIWCERVAAEDVKLQFYCGFWRSNFISCERVAFRGASLALPAP